MPTKWRCWFWDRARIACVIAREARQNALICSLWWLEEMDCNESRHEGGHWRCRQNDVIGFGIVHAAHVIAREARQNALICNLWWLEVIDCNESWHEGDMGVANKMALLVLGSRTRSAHSCAQCAPECTYLQFMMARSEGLL